MSTLKKLIYLFLFLFFIPITSYAIDVSVRTTSDKVYALGFNLNGKDYGGAGTSYSKQGLSPGKYIFGIRVGGLVIGAKDIRCPTSKSQFIMLNNNATAILKYNESTQKCLAQVYPTR